MVNLKENIGSVTTLVLQGTYQQIGYQYGQAMKRELEEVLDILKSHYITKKNISYERLRNRAQNFYERFPLAYQLFIDNVAKGSNLDLYDIKILNAMEDMVAEKGGCAFVSLAPTQTTTKATLIGRNYDYPAPFDLIARYLTVTVLIGNDVIPTAIISLPGQIYCPTGINSNGLFIEVNNGMPSGGYYVEQNRQTLLISLLQAAQNSRDLSQMNKQLNALQSDYSLIVNAADRSQVNSYEFSSLGMMKSTCSNPNKDSGSAFVSTNHYLNDAWVGLPVSSDNPWMSVTRRNNLLRLASVDKIFSVDSFKKLMDLDIKSGGAVWDLTIYQIIFDPSDLFLYIKINKESANWNKISLRELFRQ